MRLPCGALDFWPAGPWEINASGSSPWTSKSLRKQRTWVSSQTPAAGREWQRRTRVRGLAGHRKAGRKEPRVGPGGQARALSSRGSVGSRSHGRLSSRRKMQRLAALQTTDSSPAWLCPCHTCDSPLWGGLSATAPLTFGAYSVSWGVLRTVGCLQQPLDARSTVPHGRTTKDVSRSCHMPRGQNPPPKTCLKDAVAGPVDVF